MITIPQSLLEEIKKGKASLFLGAGASIEANFPTAYELSQYLIQHAGEPLTSELSGEPLDEVSEALYQATGYGKGWVRQEIINYFYQKQQVVTRPPSEAHEFMTKIKWRNIFTTNYDRLVEISYDSSAEAVQRVIPIYAPDPQITYHDPNEVRLVKLNGSIDEARRNVSHELVLTFSEQQTSLSKNKELYDMLREDAMNGPIIFIGFRFAHPGAHSAGNSPELQLLQDIISKMGMAARWHYSVTPFDESVFKNQRIVNKIKNANVHSINCTFGEFMAYLYEHLQTPTVALSQRPPVILPVSLKAYIQIDADEYEKDIRHFELIGSNVENIDHPDVKESLNGQANWATFRERHLIERSCKSDFKEVINNSLETGPSILMLSASAGWGKTFLLKDIAMDYYREGRPVIWLNPHSTYDLYSSNNNTITIGSWDTIRIDNLLNRIEKTTKNKSCPPEETVPVIFADNCPERATEVISLYRDLMRNNRSFVIVFAVRDNEFDSLMKLYPTLKKGRYFKPEDFYDSKTEVRKLIDFCTGHQIASLNDAYQRESVAQKIIQEETESSIILSLQVIFDKEHRPFSEIVKSLWQSLENEFARKLVIRVAALHRFGSAFSPRFYPLLKTFPEYESAEVVKAYRECIDKGILFEHDENGEYCVTTLHSLVAEHIVKVSGQTSVGMDDELIKIIGCMTNNSRDLEIIRRLLKRINDYEITLSGEEKAEELFNAAAKSTSNDWVVCQQFAKYYINRTELESALVWANSALENNSDHAPLHHTKGNVLRNWGMQLRNQGQIELANEKFKEARQCFSVSRIRHEPDEYGYVTHLEMLIQLMREEDDEVDKAILKAEGVQLYNDGIKSVPKDRFNLILQEKYRNEFGSGLIDDLCFKISEAVKEGRSSAFATAFLASELYKKGEYFQAIDVLRLQQKTGDNVLPWLKEAEIHTREGRFNDALKCIDSAKRREKFVENAEVKWSLSYWDLLIAVANENYGVAKEAVIKLNKTGIYTRHSFPKGYIWKEIARGIDPSKRSFKEHAKIWRGRIEDFRAKGSFGRIALTNVTGDTFYVDFNPRYFQRKDLRAGGIIQFVLTILPDGLRADDINSEPFVSTVDDIYVP